MDINERVMEAASFVAADDSIKLDVLSKYGIMADVIISGASTDIITNNIETFSPLMANNVLEWVMTEKGKPAYIKAMQTYPRIAQMFTSDSNAKACVKVLCNKCNINQPEYSRFNSVISGVRLFGVEEAEHIDIGDVDNCELDGTDDIEVQFDDSELSDYMPDDIQEENIVTETDTQGEDSVAGYNDKLHGGYRKQIENLIMSAWEDLYAYHVDGKEIVDGFIVPGGTILSHGETEKYQGIMTLSKQITIRPSTLSNALFDEFVEACHEFDIPLIKDVSDDVNEVRPFKYNPLLQRLIASGDIDKNAFKNGWTSYKQALCPYVMRKTKELAIKRVQLGSDAETYKELSGYIISLMCVNYKDELGTQLRICCGDTSKTALVANRIVERLRAREKTHQSIAQGKLIVGNAIISENGLSATINIYQNMAGYQAIPQFMGELLCNIGEGTFKPSLNHMIIGVDLKNNIVTAPFTKWLIPIIAGSRSGKGVLTLSMLLNVIGCEAPLFYLDGKPDMAAMLWKLQEKHGIERSIVIDGIGCKGVTEVDRKPYIAPYYPNMQKMMQSSTSDELLESNYGVLFYLKAMLVILLSTRYYKDQMGSCYGDIFVVFDEMFKVMKTQLETFIMNIDMSISKLTREDKDRKEELLSIKMWVTELLQTYIGNDIGVFGAGIKAVALTQFAQDGQYAVSGYTVSKQFCTNFLLKRAVKLFGRQEGGSGIYGVTRDKNDEVNFSLYDKYFHFGVGTEQGNTYNSLKTFKPLLVLNENDCKEITGNSTDGAFVADMLNRISKYSDVDQFRDKYFRQQPLADSIGFEGALAQVGRLMNRNWQEMLKNSMDRAYEISDKALRYYGVIGTDNIDSVYDYICSFEVKHLWSYNTIIRAKAKGISLGTNTISKDGNSVFNGFTPDFEDAESGEDVIDFGDTEQEEIKDQPREKPREQSNIINGAFDITKGSFGGVIKGLNSEEQDIIKDLHLRKQDGTFETGSTDDISTYSSSIDPKPYEEYGYDPAFTTGGSTGKTVYIDPSNTQNAFKLTDENSISASMDADSPYEKYEKMLFKTLKGSQYEFDKRWKSILNSVGKKINPNLVSRVMVVQDEIYVNSRYVATSNILGGFANIRLEDIVNFSTMFKKFPNIADLAIDTVMLERLQIEKPNLPIGFFEMGSKLARVSIIFEDGTKEVINRNSAISDRADAAIKNAKINSMFSSVCAAKNPRFKDTSPGYQNKVWNATKSFSGNGWRAIQQQLTKQNPSFIKATGLFAVTAGVVAVGGGLTLIGKAAGGIRNLFHVFRG